MKRSSAISIVLALAALVSTAAFASPAAKTRKAFLYKVTSDITAHVEVVGDATGTGLQYKENSTMQTATWKIHPQKGEIWLVAYDGVLDNKVTSGSGSDNQSGGSLTATETFTYFNHSEPLHPLRGNSDCKGTVQNDLNVQYTAEATAGGTTFTVDLAGGVHPTGDSLPCENTPPEREVPNQPTGPTVWEFKWNPEVHPDATNQKMELGANIQNFQVGMPSLSPKLTDYSLVKNAAVCKALSLTSCTVTFVLDGEVELTRVCGVTVVGNEAPTCGASSGGGSTKKPPPTHNPPKLTHLSVSPHAFSLAQAAVVSYRLDQDGTHTLVKVLKALHIAAINKTIDVPVEVFTHADKGRTVSLPLPKTFAGRALSPGHYTLEATPMSASLGNGTAVKTTFVITS